jgi:hypothetical protein
MAPKINFYDSMGGEEALPSVEWLKDKVFNGDDGFWEGATGETALSYGNGKVGASLYLIGREKYGFMVQHKYKGDKERRHTLRFGEHKGETVTAAVGGNPGSYYREYFVPKEVAWQAIEHLLKTGERKPDLTWEIAEYPEQEV